MDAALTSEDTPLLQNVSRSKSPSSRTWRKLDLHLLSVVTLMLFFGFMDRGNIGNALVAGLQTDLGLSDDQYSMILTINWIPYILSMIPATYLLERVGADKILPSMIILWGIASVMQGFVRGFIGLAVCRFLFGVFTGGLIPCVALYLTSFYPRYMVQFRISVFFATAAFAGAISGLLAAAITKLDGVLGKPGWAWIFISEGAVTTLFGVISLFLFPRSLSDAHFLTLEERISVGDTLREDGMTLIKSNKNVHVWDETLEVVKNPQVLLICFATFFGGSTESGLIFFEPIIVKGLGYDSTLSAQLMSVPPFAAAAVFTLWSGVISDKYRCRGLTSALSSAVCVLGFAIFLASSHDRVRYASLLLTLPGTFCSAPALGAWVANNVAPYTRRGIALSITSISSCLGGVLASWILGSWSTPPKYTVATIIFLVFSVGGVLCSIVNLRYVVVANRKKEKLRGLSRAEDELEGLGDRSAWFIYSL